MPNWSRLIKTFAAGTKEAFELAAREGKQSSALRQLSKTGVGGKEVLNVATDTLHKDMRIIRFADGGVMHAPADLTGKIAALEGGTTSIRKKIPTGQEVSPENVALDRFDRNYKKAYFNESRQRSKIERDYQAQKEMAAKQGIEFVDYELLAAPDGVLVMTPAPDVETVIRSGRATRLKKGQRRGQKKKD